MLSRISQACPTLAWIFQRGKISGTDKSIPVDYVRNLQHKNWISSLFKMALLILTYQALWAIMQLSKGRRKSEISATRNTSLHVFILLCNSSQSKSAAGHSVYVIWKFGNCSQDYFWILFTDIYNLDDWFICMFWGFIFCWACAWILTSPGSKKLYSEQSKRNIFI